MGSPYDMPIQDLSKSFEGGIKTGQDYARAAQMLKYRKQQLDSHQQQIQNQDAQHKYKLMDKMTDYLMSLSSMPAKDRMKVFPIVEKKAKTMGLDISDWKPLISDPGFQVDVAGPLKQMVRGMQNNSPEDMSQGFAQFRGVIQDPVMGRQALNNIMGSVRQNQVTDKKFGNQKELAGIKNDLSAEKQGSKDITTYQKAMNADPAMKNIDKQLDQVAQVKSQIDLAKDNPVAYNMLPLQLAQTVIHQRLNVQEIKAAGSSQAFMERAEQAAKKMAKGTLTDDNASFMHSLVDQLEKSGMQRKKVIETQYTNQYLQLPGNNGKDFDSAYQTLTGKDYTNIEHLSKEEISSLKEGVKAAKAAGVPDEQLRPYLEKQYGTSFTNSDLGKVGLSSKKAAAPSAPSAAPVAPSMTPNQMNTMENMLPPVEEESDTNPAPTPPVLEEEEE